MTRLGILFSGALLAACGSDEDASRLTTGAELYGHYCSRCHRDDGAGSFLKGVPPIRDTDLGYGELVTLIQGHARPEGSRMPDFRTLPRRKAEAIAIHVRRQLRTR